MVYRATVVLPEECCFLELELLLAALRLSAFAGHTLGRSADRRWFAGWLEAMALLVGAWTSLAFTLQLPSSTRLCPAKLGPKCLPS